ncbi:diaminobutyrate acetyltransferase [Marinobacterium jannaschii]|uniref:diaminobutyrate acetyltransferase n=1 Tax=Marinobacterium jannaschii TaxID=64970 RepID=UPI0004890FD6|nr:diaminobutyrate acetyltransferase [Marinobacterium jannaschii]
MDIEGLTLRKPVATDGMAVNRLVDRIPELDDNSSYCNLLQCSHFADSSVIALRGDEVAGFISGYPLPQQPDTLFIWQVAVSPDSRGIGLASSMLSEILSRPDLGQLRFLETTITEDNAASWALFTSLARRCSARLERRIMFDRQRHFSDEHASELLARIGPIRQGALTPQP